MDREGGTDYLVSTWLKLTWATVLQRPLLGNLPKDVTLGQSHLPNSIKQVDTRCTSCQPNSKAPVTSSKGLINWAITKRQWLMPTTLKEIEDFGEFLRSIRSNVFIDTRDIESKGLFLETICFYFRSKQSRAHTATYKSYSFSLVILTG